MIKKLLHLLFGLHGITGNRTVAGSAEGDHIKSLPYIQDSHRRLAALGTLCSRYKGSRHAQRLKAVLDKTQQIHAYLVERKRVHELELFHVQYTDHFLAAFSVIADAHERHNGKIGAVPAAAAKNGTWDSNERTRYRQVVQAAPQRHQQVKKVAVDLTLSEAEVPKLHLPQIAINTYSKIVYRQDAVEIGFTSTAEEKEAFEAYVAAQFGIADITYVGNALVYMPAQANARSAEMLPVIHWHGAPYVLLLEEARLFAVRTYRANC